MKWFERHLILIFGFGVPALTVILILTAIEFNWHINADRLQYEFILYEALLMFFATTAAVTGIFLYLLRKNLSKWFITPFLIPLVFPLVCLILYHLAGFHFFTTVVFFLMYIPAFIWLVGLACIWIADCKRKTELSLRISRKLTTVLKSVICISAIVALSVTVFSFCRMNYGTYQVTEYSYQSTISGIKGNFEYFTTQCPNKYKNYTWFGGNRHWNDPEIQYTFEKSPLISPGFSWITVYIFPERLDSYREKFSSLSEACIDAFYENSEFGWRKWDVVQLDFKNVEIDGNPAEYTTLLLYEKEGEWNSGGFFEQVRMVCFERDSDIWVIVSTENEITSKNPDFDKFFKYFHIFGFSHEYNGTLLASS